MKNLILLLTLIIASTSAFGRMEYRQQFVSTSLARIQEPLLHLGQSAPVVLPGYGLVPFEVDRRRHHRHERPRPIPRTPEQRYMGLIVAGTVLTGLGVSGAIFSAAMLPNDSPDNPVALGLLMLSGILFLVGTGTFLAGWYMRSNYKKSVEVIIED